MNLNAILLNYGSVLEAGRTRFVWNPDGTLQTKYLYADQSKTEMVYENHFTWNPDGSLQKWRMVVTTTGEEITKLFAWNANGSLNEAGVTA